MKARLRSILKLILGNVVVLLGILVILEVSLEVCLRNPGIIPQSGRNLFQSYYGYFDRLVIQYSKDHAEYDKDYFYKLKEGNRVYENREFSTSMEINSSGFRDDEESIIKPDIVFLGDSHTMGWGVEKEETFESIIEDSLQLKCANTAVSSFATVRQFKTLKELNLSNTRAIILQYCSNDSSENRIFLSDGYKLKISTQEEYFDYSKKHDLDNNYFPFKHLIKITSLFGTKMRYKYSRSTNKPVEYKNEAEINFAKVLKYHLADIDERINIIIINIDGRHCDSGFLNRLRNVLDNQQYDTVRNRIQLIDIAPLIEESDYYILDDHLKKSGHRKIANHLLKIIKW